MPAGRPTKYRTDYCEKIVELLGQGYSLIEFAAEIGVCEDTVYRWAKDHPEFSEAKKRASKLSQAWWEKEARVSLRDKDFNATLWYMNMKNRFGWSDKQHLEHSGPDGDAIKTDNKITVEFVGGESDG